MIARSLAYGSALVALSLSGVACKGGGSSSSAFLEVIQTAPERGSDAVPVEVRIGFQIDVPIDEATLTSDNFFVVDSEGTRVQGALSIGDEPSIAVLTPDEPLSVITTYTATITTGLMSTGGATLEEAYDWSFTTLDSAWGESEWLEEVSMGISADPQIVVDGQSNALAAWEYTEATGTFIWANRYTRVGLWGEPEPIDDGNGGATHPRIATDDAGNGFAVWEQRQQGASTVNIWTNRYTVDQGWGTAELLQNDEATTARSPSVAADPAGNAIAVWVQQDVDTREQAIWASRYEPGTGWTTAEPIDPMPSLTAGERTSIGMDDEGNAIAVWARPMVPTSGVGRSELLWANRYTPGSGWATAELIKPDIETRAQGERLSVGPSGEAFVIWLQNDPMRLCPAAPCQDVWAVRFSGSSWGTPERVDNYDDDDKEGPDIAVDGSGVAHAVWSQTDPDFKNIWANQYTPGSGWGSPELIEPPNPDPNEDADAATPRVGVNAAGNAFVVWRQTWEDWGSIWSNRLDPGTGWMTAELIEDIGRSAKGPRIAVDENRHAHAVWLHSRDTGIDWVRTNRFE